MRAGERRESSSHTRSVAARRAELFRETLVERVERRVLGAAWALKPERVGDLPALGALWLSHRLGLGETMPDAGSMQRPSGLCGIADDLSPATLLRAYRSGLFPGGHVAPVKWFSPPQRCVLFFDELRIEKSVRRLMRNRRYTFTFDRDFEGVIKACAGRRPGKWHVTWITPPIMRAYAELYDAGHVHSYEIWNEDGELAGGGYGVAIGRAFFGESQFSRESNAGKIAQTMLAWHLDQWNFLFDDSKWASPAMLKMGFRVVPREDFCALAARATRAFGAPGRWRAEAAPAEVASWRPRVRVSLAPETATERQLATARTTRRHGALLPVLPAFDQSTLGIAETLLALI